MAQVVLVAQEAQALQLALQVPQSPMRVAVEVVLNQLVAQEAQAAAVQARFLEQQEVVPRIQAAAEEALEMEQQVLVEVEKL
jgi:hypothetical protein